MTAGYTADELLHDAVIAVDLSRPEVADAYGGSDRLTFQFMPEEISDSVTPNWEQIDILGRSEPFQAYSNTSAREFSFDLEFYAVGSGMSQTPSPAPRQIVKPDGSTQYEMRRDTTTLSLDQNPEINNAIDSQVLRRVRFLQSLAYPILDQSGYVTPPTTCWLIIGELIMSMPLLAKILG